MRNVPSGNACPSGLPKKLALASAISAAALLAACGGGGADKMVGQTSSDTVTASEGTDLAVRATAQGLKKEAFSLGDGVGTYGQQMQSAGWTFKPVIDIGSVPNRAETIVYISSSSARLDTARLASQLVGFKGTLVVDSDQTVKAAPSISALGADSSSPTPPAQPATDTSQDTPAGQLLRDLMADKIGVVPKSTAIMTSQTTRTVFALNVDTAGLVNGYNSAEFDEISPMLYALYAKDIADGKQKAETFGQKVSSQSAGDKVTGQDVAAADYTQTFDTKVNGYVMRGRFYVYAYRDLGPTFVNANKYVTVKVDTGSDENFTGCNVNNKSCGVYAESTAALVPILAVGTTGNIIIATPPYRYAAIAEVQAATSVTSWTPSKAYYDSDSAKSTDSWETTWSSGFAYGPSVSVSLASFGLPFSFGGSASKSYSQSFTKRTFAWKGWELNEDTSVGREFHSGIESVNNKIRSGFPTNGAITGTSGSAYDYLARAIQNGTYDNCNVPESSYCHSSDLTLQTTDGSVRSKIAWGGWKPGVSVTMQIPTSYFPSTTSTKTISVRAGVTLDRSHWHLDKTTIQAPDGAHYVTGFLATGAPTSHRLVDKGSVYGTPYSDEHFGASASVTVGANSFNN